MQDNSGDQDNTQSVQVQVLSMQTEVKGKKTRSMAHYRSSCRSQPRTLPALRTSLGSHESKLIKENQSRDQLFSKRKPSWLGHKGRGPLRATPTFYILTQPMKEVSINSR